MQLGEIMNTRVVTIDAEDSAAAAWTRMRRRGIRHLVVMKDARPAGVLSERDLGGRTGTNIRKGRKVRSLMTPSIVSAEPDTTVREAADLMRARLIGSLPVLEGDQLVGIVTATDVFDALAATARRPLTQSERQLLSAPSTSKRLGGRPTARRRSQAHDESERASHGTRGSETRAPFAARLPRATKRAAGRTSAPLVPAHIRAMGVDLPTDDRDYIRRKLGTRLGKFATAIERVSVRVRDVNGPRGGIDRECRIKVVLSGLPSVAFEAQAASLKASVDGALTGIERSVRRSVQRRRTTPSPLTPPPLDET